MLLPIYTPIDQTSPLERGFHQIFSTPSLVIPGNAELERFLHLVEAILTSGEG